MYANSEHESQDRVTDRVGNRYR